MAAPPALTEAAFQQQIVELAGLYGWRLYHTYESRRSNPGWPDLVLMRPPELVYAELKTEKGRVSPAQRRWLYGLARCGCEVYIWRPSDFDGIHERLKKKSPLGAGRTTNRGLNDGG